MLRCQNKLLVPRGQSAAFIRPNTHAHTNYEPLVDYALRSEPESAQFNINHFGGDCGRHAGLFQLPQFRNRVQELSAFVFYAADHVAQPGPVHISVRRG